MEEPGDEGTEQTQKLENSAGIFWFFFQICYTG